MRWSQPIDYHGSRSYETDEAAPRLFSLAALANWLKQKFRKTPPRRSSATILLLNGEQHFSILGASSPRNPRGRIAECPFPTASRTKTDPGSASCLRHED